MKTIIEIEKKVSMFKSCIEKLNFIKNSNSEDNSIVLNVNDLIKKLENENNLLLDELQELN